MSLWVVVTPKRSPTIHKLVTRVLAAEKLADGRVLWTVEAPDEVMEALAEASEGYLSVEPCGFITNLSLLGSGQGDPKRHVA